MPRASKKNATKATRRDEIKTAPKPRRRKKTVAKATNDTPVEKSIKPTEPTEPMEPMEPTEEVKSTKPTKPTKPTEPTEPTEPSDSSEPTKSKKKKRRNFRLYSFNPENGKAPKGGGYYSATSPQLAAKKAANRWVCPKDVFDEEITFRMREVTAGSKKDVYEFSAKRVKLEKPKEYKRGEKTIRVDSKIVITA